MQPDAPLLEVRDLAKIFGGIRAVDGVSFDVRKGDIMGLIGPNGAGKTTTFNLVSGRFAATAGSVRFGGRLISGMRPDRISALGIARTFQGTRIFPQLTVAQNVETALLSRLGTGFWADWLGLPAARRRQLQAAAEVDAVLSFIGLSHLSQAQAGSLAYAHQSLLGIAIALALKPVLLLLDEPFAGMNPRETEKGSELVRRIRDTGVTVLLVEHDMAAVMGLCDHILVLEQGKPIAEGSPDRIRSDPRVIEAYLGTDEDA